MPKREEIKMFDLIQELKKIPGFLETIEDESIEYAVNTYFGNLFRKELRDSNFPFELEERWEENEEGYAERTIYIVLKRISDGKFFIMHIEDTGELSTDSLTLSEELVEVKKKKITKTIWTW